VDALTQYAKTEVSKEVRNVVTSEAIVNYLLGYNALYGVPEEINMLTFFSETKNKTMSPSIISGNLMAFRLA